MSPPYPDLWRPAAGGGDTAYDLGRGELSDQSCGTVGGAVYLNQIVILLSWSHLKRPGAAPLVARAGVLLTTEQWATVRRLRKSSMAFESIGRITVNDLGRSATKYETVEKRLGSFY